MSQTVTVTATDYEVKDISQASLGRKRIEMAEKVCFIENNFNDFSNNFVISTDPIFDHAQFPSISLADGYS